MGTGLRRCDGKKSWPSRAARTLARGDRAGAKEAGSNGLPAADWYGFGPVVDGHDLPHHPFDPTGTNVSDDVPVLVGGTKDENAIFLAPDDAVWNRTLSEDELKTRVADAAGRDTDTVLALYRQMHPGMNPAELLIESTTDARFWVRSVLPAERCDRHFTGCSPAAPPIAATESATWATFARTGMPDNKLIPHWPAYTAADRATMMIDAKWRVQNDPQLLWTRIALK